jgi:hypothetical protein
VSRGRPAAWLAAAGAAAFALWAFLASPDLPSRAAHDYLRVRDGALLVEERSDDPEGLEAFFSEKAFPFPVRVRDLRGRGYRLRGGRVHAIAGRPSALVVYRGPSDELFLCETFAGTMSDLPKPDEETGQAAVYRRESTTQIFRQAGPALEGCVSAGGTLDLDG